MRFYESFKKDHMHMHVAKS